MVILLIALIASGCSRHAGPGRTGDLREATCVGPRDAKLFAVYLHGVDSPSVSSQELRNRKSLERISRALSMRVALPRATTSCPGQKNSICWGWSFDDAEVSRAVRIIRKSAQACLGAHRYGLIGFSNGGYLLSKLVRTCSLHRKLPRAQWIVTVGSALLKGPLKPQPRTLAGCGRMVMVEGTRDVANFDSSDHLLHALAAKGAEVRAVRFDGGHVLPEKPVESAIQRLVQ